MSAAAVEATTQQKQPVGDELKQAIKRQVEFYFSKANLATDAFLVSQMNSQMYVPVDVVASFSKVQQLTNSTALLVDAIRDSSVVSLNDAGDAIKPNLKSERNTIILREIPSATPPADVEAIFAGCGGNVVSVRSDVGDTWFVTMASEEDAVNTLLALRSKKFNDAPIKARLKSENTLKSFFPTQPAESAVAPGGAYSSRGYYGAAPVGYYDVPNNYGVQYHAVNNARAPYSNGAVDNRYTTPRGGRGAAAGGAYRQHNQGGRGAAPQQQKDGKAAEQQPRSTPSASSKKSKAEKKAAKQAAAPASNGTAGKKGAAAPAAERQPILSSSNFPPLPTGEKPSDAPIQHTYHHEDIMEIVKHMDETDCTLPAGKMDFDAHPAALTAVAHPDLLRNQRTYSIEQAREAMRQGRPIRSDSVGSIDYESMMYGEDYTKEARELRKQNSDGAVAAGADGKSAASTAAPKVFSFASAVIHGTPAPADVVVAKKKPAAAAATPASAEKAKTPKAAAKDDKKAGKKASKAAESKAAAVDEILPKAGAWGGRNFLDVVKSEPAAVQPPAAPVKAAAPAPAKDAKPKAAK
uniref:HTH La-type RNA-binding domain-containing protein n=1 Tax=Globisporangium ultimum (strain ATCC 200006 / CBS 805.95 / DAOM BR144) TaxID=431595 RepID=K3W7U4_GLOUD